MRIKFHNILRMFYRRRIFRRALFLVLTFSVSIYACILLFGDLRSPVLTSLTELHRCPACYGVSICPELYSGKIGVDSKLHHIFNAKNVYYGTTKSGARVVLKKLAHYFELKDLDRILCGFINKTEGCDVNDLLNITNMDEIMKRLVTIRDSEDTQARAGLIMCPQTDGLSQLLHPVMGKAKTNIRVATLNTLVMLLVNAEPLILQVLDHREWPVSAYVGACGRLIVVQNAGNTLAHMLHEPWNFRLKIADQILRAAADFTFKHERFRFYLMDWSLDNIAVNENGRVTFIDLEDIIVLDKHTSPSTRLPDWYMRYNREFIAPGYTFSIERMCQHHLSDHNLWSACYLLAGDDTPLLLPLPRRMSKRRPHLENLLMECLRGGDRFKAVERLLKVFEDILGDTNR